MISIADLLARGQIAFAAHMASVYTPDTLPIGVSSVNVVTREDFIRYADVCLDFVTTTRSLHILDFDGSIWALLSRYGRGRSIAP